MLATTNLPPRVSSRASPLMMFSSLVDQPPPWMRGVDCTAAISSILASSCQFFHLACDARPGLNVGHEVPRLSPVNPLLPSDYGTTLKALQQRIRQARARVILSANSALVLLYWEIGRTILERQTREGWGAKVVDRLARDLRRSFPDMQGLSPRNLQFMRSFAAEFPDETIVKQLASQLPWGRPFYHHPRASTT